VALDKCPSCGQSVLDVATRCPKCGFALLQHHRLRDAASEAAGRAMRRKSGSPALLFTLLLVGAAITAIVLVGRLGDPALSEFEFAPEPAATPGVMVPADSPAPLVPAPAPPVRSALRDTIRVPPVAGAITRWTNDWANVRAGRALEDSVVAVIPPGRQIQVAGRVEGWWVVYLDGLPVGFVAGSLLSPTPPDTVGAALMP
jgi:hypothetical protein